MENAGIPWGLVILLSVALVRMFQLYTRIQEARIAEGKEAATRDVELTHTLRGLTTTLKAFMAGKG